MLSAPSYSQLGGLNLDEQIIRVGEAVTMSVERMIQFCYIAKIGDEYKSGSSTANRGLRTTVQSGA